MVVMAVARSTASTRMLIRHTARAQFSTAASTDALDSTHDDGGECQDEADAGYADPCDLTLIYLRQTIPHLPG